MSEQLAVPLKTAVELNLEECLKPFFSEKRSFGPISLPFLKSKTSGGEAVEKAIKDLDKLRKDVVSKKPPKSIFSLEQLYRYHDQIAILEAKFPSETALPFTWEDAFSKASVFSGKPSLALPFLGYEKLCVLFNIAALQTQLAVEGTIVDTDEERKNAMKYYQSAAGILERLQPAEQAGDNLTPDFHPDLLTGLSALLLAQAQEIFVTKAIKDKMKDVSLAKICAQTEELFSEALIKMTREKCKYTLDSSWLKNVKAKKYAYLGLGNYFQSKVCAEKKNIGEEIARLNLAIENIKSAQDKICNSNYLSYYMGEAKRLVAAATKDNDFIYHEVVPPASHLTPIPKVASARLAKITPMPEKFAADFQNPFSSLLDASKEPEQAQEAIKEKDVTQIGWTVEPPKSPVPPPRKKKDDGDASRSESPPPVKEPPVTKTNVRAPTWNQVMNDSWSLLKPYFEEALSGKK